MIAIAQVEQRPILACGDKDPAPTRYDPIVADRRHFDKQCAPLQRLWQVESSPKDVGVTDRRAFARRRPISNSRKHSRGALSPGLCMNLPYPLITEGAGNAGRTMRPQPRMQNKTKHTSVVTTGSPESPGISCTMVLTAPPWSPWCTGLVSHHHLRELRPAN
jgi:hypothetical protein